jgi:hypothetical protein
MIFCCAQRTTACSSSGIDSTKVDLYFLANKLFFRFTVELQPQLQQANVCDLNDKYSFYK